MHPSPEHHANFTRSLFKNPWLLGPSNPTVTQGTFPYWPSSLTIPFPSVSIQRVRTGTPPHSHPPCRPVKVVKPDWGHSATIREPNLKATWLGHAVRPPLLPDFKYSFNIYIKSFLVEFPRVVTTAVGPDDSDEPPRVLFDPIFSNTAGPSPWLSTQRRLPPPCTLTELPEFQFVVYSHNQCVLSLCESLSVFNARPKITCSYDHLDLPTLQQIHTLRRQYVHFLVPLGQFLYPFPTSCS